MKFLFGLVLASLAACGGAREASAPGPLGPVEDLRRFLAKDILERAPQADAGGLSTYNGELVVKGVTLRATWHAFVASGGKYLLDAKWEVVRAAPGIMVENVGARGPAVNAGPPEAAVEQLDLQVRFHDNNASGTSWGDGVLTIRGDGTSAHL